DLLADERLVAEETAQVLLDRGHAAPLTAVLQLDPQQLTKQRLALGPADLAEEVLDTRLLPRLPGGLEPHADLVDPFVHVQREGLPPAGSLRSHAALLPGPLTRRSRSSQDYSASGAPHAGSSLSQRFRIRASFRSTVDSEHAPLSAFSISLISS